MAHSWLERRLRSNCTENHLPILFHGLTGNIQSELIGEHVIVAHAQKQFLYCTEKFITYGPRKTLKMSNILYQHRRGLNSLNFQIISLWIKNIAIFKASFLLYLHIFFFQMFSKKLFVKSFSVLHNDKLRRIVRHPQAAKISISYRIPIESGI